MTKNSDHEAKEDLHLTTMPVCTRSSSRPWPRRMRGHSIAYGDDPLSKKTIMRMKEIFGMESEIFFVFIGTAANVLGINAATQPYQAVICPETAHINVDECGAPEKFSGCKLLPVATPDGKLTVEGVKKHMHGIGFEHHVQPRVISITQATELGTLYSLDEIRAISAYAHANNMLVHMDGARIANAAAALDVGFFEMTGGSGVDLLSFGGTKNGMMYGEAIVFFNPQLASVFKYQRKQGMQLASKMRFISAQFGAYLENDLWKINALHANQDGSETIQGCKRYSGCDHHTKGGVQRCVCHHSPGGHTQIAGALFLL